MTLLYPPRVELLIGLVALKVELIVFRCNVFTRGRRLDYHPVAGRAVCQFCSRLVSEWISRDAVKFIIVSQRHS